MNARQRYYFLRHQERLLNWQIETVEKQIRIERERKRIAIRNLRWAHKRFKLGIQRVIEANRVAYLSVVHSQH